MFFSRSTSKLGIDIGTSSIKVVQLKREAKQFFLETYGIVNVAYPPAAIKDFDVLAETASILKRLLKESKVTAKKVVASLPNNIVFVSVIEMPVMSEKELKSAVEWEAQRYVPLPLSEVTLSWSLLDQGPSQEKLKVLLTAVPTSVIENYLKTFKLAGLMPLALEIEALALIRSLVGPRKESFLIIDIGARSTSLNLVDNGFLRVSRNLAVGGETITAGIAKSLHVSTARAEQFKHDLGAASGGQAIPQAVRPVLDTIKTETAQLVRMYHSGGGRLQELIFAGSGSRLPGLLNYFADLGIKTEAGDPLKFIVYNAKIQSNLSQVASSLAVALGLAMRE